MQTPSDTIEMYLLAKDGNRPHLIERAFAGGDNRRFHMPADRLARSVGGARFGEIKLCQLVGGPAQHRALGFG